VRQKIADDVGPLGLGNEISCGILRETVVDYFKNFIEISGGDRSRELL